MVKCPRPTKRRHGFRFGEVLEHNALKVLKWEVEESGNWPMLGEFAKAFDVKPNFKAINDAIKLCYGSDAQAIWLTKTRKQAEEYYGPGEADKIKIPEGAGEIVDLKDEGQLYVYRKQRLEWL